MQAPRLTLRYSEQSTSRRLPGILTLRDVRDVEERITGQLEELGLSPADRDHEALVLDAIGLAYRVERALPPGTALEPVLRRVLDDRLAARALRLRSAA